MMEEMSSIGRKDKQTFSLHSVHERVQSMDHCNVDDRIILIIECEAKNFFLSMINAAYMSNPLICIILGVRHMISAKGTWCSEYSSFMYSHGLFSMSPSPSSRSHSRYYGDEIPRRFLAFMPKKSFRKRGAGGRATSARRRPQGDYVFNTYVAYLHENNVNF